MSVNFSVSPTNRFLSSRSTTFSFSFGYRRYPPIVSHRYILKGVPPRLLVRIYTALGIPIVYDTRPEIKQKREKVTQECTGKPCLIDMYCKKKRKMDFRRTRKRKIDTIT